jgi:hypothetical protein
VIADSQESLDRQQKRCIAFSRESPTWDADWVSVPNGTGMVSLWESTLPCQHYRIRQPLEPSPKGAIRQPIQFTLCLRHTDSRDRSGGVMGRFTVKCPPLHDKSEFDREHSDSHWTKKTDSYKNIHGLSRIATNCSRICLIGSLRGSSTQTAFSPSAWTIFTVTCCQDH